MKKIAIIGNSDFNYSASEFNQLSEQLIRYLKVKYVFFTYHTSSNSIKQNDSKIAFTLVHNSTIKNVMVPPVGRYLFAIIHALCYADVVLVENFTAAWFFPLIRFLSRKKIILQVLPTTINSKKTNRFLKYVLALKEKIAFRYCHHIITNHEPIQDFIVAKHNVFPDLIEQGADQVERIESTFSDHMHYPFLKYMYAVSFFESEEEKCAEIILEAFKLVKHKYLVMIGDWSKNNYSIFIKNKYAGYANIFMLHSIHDKRHLDLIRSNAVLFIHASGLANNSRPLLEAMSLKLPVLAFESIDSKYLTEGKASYFTNRIDVNHYLNTLNMEKLRKNAFAMSDIALKRFAWSNLACKYEIVIDRLLCLNNKKSLLFSFRNSDDAFFQNKAHYLKPRLAIFKTIFNFFL